MTIKMRCSYLVNRTMHNLQRLLVVAIAAGTFTSPASAAKEAAATRDGWSIQQSTKLFGDISVIVSAKGVKATSRSQSLSMLCVSPFTEVVLFSERSKKCSVRPFSQFRCPAGRTLAVVNSGLLNEAPMVHKQTLTYQGMKVNVFASTAQFKATQLARFRAREIPSRGPMSVECFYSALILKSIRHIGLAPLPFSGPT